MPATEIVTCAAQGQKGGSRWRKAALQLRRRHSGLNAFAKGRLAEIFDAPFEFFVVPVDLFVERIDLFVERIDPSVDCPNGAADFSEQTKRMVLRLCHQVIL